MIEWGLPACRRTKMYSSSKIKLYILFKSQYLATWKWTRTLFLVPICSILFQRCPKHKVKVQVIDSIRICNHSFFQYLITSKKKRGVVIPPTKLEIPKINYDLNFKPIFNFINRLRDFIYKINSCKTIIFMIKKL